MRLLRTTIALFFAAKSVLLCQTVTISEILDANLFKLSDGRLVKLAGVDAPNDSSQIPYLRIMASNAKTFMNSYSRTKLKMDSIDYDSNNRFSFVILYKQYKLQDVCINELYIKNGFAKHFENTKSFNAYELIKAQEYAVKYDIGIWKFFTPTKKDTLDYMLAKSSPASLLQPDSNKLGNLYNQTPIVGRIAVQLLAGSSAALISTFVGAGIVALDSKKKGLEIVAGGIIGLGVGYLIGFPTVIYLIEKEENPNLNYWENLGCSWGLTLATSLLATHVKERNHPVYYLAFFSPVIGSLLYAHLIAPKYPTSNNSLLIPERRINTFKDFREAQTTSIELFRIHF
ncbi:MAG: thermonuclease family protein [Bacteroidota bacterium]